MKKLSDQDVTIVDGSLDFSGGVNSYLVPTVASEQNPNGLKRNQVAWLDNGTFRGGGITQRPAWKKLGVFPDAAIGRFQGGEWYLPNQGDPYLLLSIEGHIWKMQIDHPETAVDLSIQFQKPSQNLVTPTGQITITYQQTSAGPVAGTYVAPGTSAVIGDFYAFLAPGIGNSVRIGVKVPYAGALVPGVVLGPGVGVITGTITATNGFTYTASPQSPITLPTDREECFFCQAEQFMVIQAGDLKTMALIWDGVTLRYSLGLYGNGFNLASIGVPAGTVVANVPSLTTVTLPAAAGGTSVIALDRAFTGGVGDYVLFTLNTPGIPIPYGISWSTMLLIGVVTAIGATNITVAVLDKYPSLTWGSSFATSNWVCVIPYIVYPTPVQINTVESGTPEIPPAGPMDYFMGRIWYAQDNKYAAGDIVGSQVSGTQAYNFRDSVLKVTENPLCLAGDGFAVPTNSGSIRAIKHSANINTALGQGQLYIFTRTAVYSLTVPVTRTNWIAATNDNQPLQQVVQITNGAVGSRSVTEQNGDLFYLSMEPAIRSLILAIRYYDQWGNVPISVNENRILKFNDRSLMRFSSMVSFDNRVLTLLLPEQGPLGVVHRAMAPINFDNISTMENKLPPIWEGMWEGLGVMQLIRGDYNGRERTVMAVFSEQDRNLQLWEISTGERFEGGDNRVQWYIEFPAFTWGDEFSLKKLVSAELWVDRLFGEVMFSMEYRPDGDVCWYKWHEWSACTARDSCEDAENPHCLYPKAYCESFRQTMVLPAPPVSCQRTMGRPTIYGFQFQTKLTIKGFCRLRGLLLKAEKVKQQLYGSDMVC